MSSAKRHTYLRELPGQFGGAAGRAAAGVVRQVDPELPRRVVKRQRRYDGVHHPEARFSVGIRRADEHVDAGQRDAVRRQPLGVRHPGDGAPLVSQLDEPDEGEDQLGNEEEDVEGDRSAAGEDGGESVAEEEQQ